MDTECEKPDGTGRVLAADIVSRIFILSEPWWKTLRSLALAGRFFETWEQVEDAIEKAKDYWNAHRHP